MISCFFLILFDILTLSALVNKTSFLFGIGPLFGFWVFINFFKQINDKILTLEKVIIILRYINTLKILF